MNDEYMKEKLSGIMSIWKSYLIACVMIFAMSEVISISCMHDFRSGVLFTTFLILGVLVPGTAGLLLLGWKKELSWRACAFSFVIGYCLSLFEYFIVMLLGLKLYVPYIVMVLAVVSCFIILRRIKTYDFELDTKVHISDQRVVFVFSGIMFLTALFASCFCNLVQPVVVDSSPENDMMFWVGNIIALTKEFPPRSFTKYPDLLTYHYFSSAQLAFACFFTRIRPIYIGLFFSVVQSVILRVSCGYLVVSKCTDKIKHRVFAMVLLFFSSGIESMTVITYQSHLYYAPFGAEYGLSIFLVFLYLIFVKAEEENNSIKASALVWICLFVLAGEKISYGGIALLGLGILCMGLMLKKQYANAIITGIPALSIFVAEYFTMINLSRFVNNPNSHYGGNSFVPIWTTMDMKLYESINKVTSLVDLPASLFFIVFFFFLASPVCFFCVIYNTCKLTKEKKWSIADFTFLIMYLTGYLVMIFIQMNGMSNMYFAFVSFPVAIIWFIKTGFPDKNATRAILVIFATLSIIGFLHGYDNTSLLDYVKKGYSLVTNGYIPEESHEEASYVSWEEYEAYEWIYDTSPKNCMIATNRTQTRSVGAFTERYVNNTKYENSIFTQTSDEEREQSLEDYKKMGVEYIVYEPAYGERLELIDKMCDIAWQNDSVIIYKTP